MSKPHSPAPVGLDITNRRDLVSICYSTWFNAILDRGDTPIERWHNVTEIQAGRQDWGPKNAFHYWSKPALGYYRSDERAVIRTHMTQLAEAGVDFIIMDYTYESDHNVGSRFWEIYTRIPMDAICDTIIEMRAEGLKAPYIVFWLGTGYGPLYKLFYDRYLNVDKWRDCFVYWNEKPFVLTWTEDADTCPYLDRLTVRTMRGLGSVIPEKRHWSFLTIDTWGQFAPAPDGTPEQVTVSVATQETYMSLPTAHGRQGGLFWFKQWYNAFAIRPKIVTLTWWNEWCAQRLEVAPNVYEFTDNYDIEHSRDLEPMEGGHGDLYYRRLKDYIAAYKAHTSCPVTLMDDDRRAAAEAWIASLPQ